MGTVVTVGTMGAIVIVATGDITGDVAATDGFTRVVIVGTMPAVDVSA